MTKVVVASSDAAAAIQYAQMAHSFAQARKADVMVSLRKEFQVGDSCQISRSSEIHPGRVVAVNSREIVAERGLDLAKFRFSPKTKSELGRGNTSPERRWAISAENYEEGLFEAQPQRKERWDWLAAWARTFCKAHEQWKLKGNSDGFWRHMKMMRLEYKPGWGQSNATMDLVIRLSMWGQVWHDVSVFHTGSAGVLRHMCGVVDGAGRQLVESARQTWKPLRCAWRVRAPIYSLLEKAEAGKISPEGVPTTRERL